MLIIDEVWVVNLQPSHSRSYLYQNYFHVFKFKSNSLFSDSEYRICILLYYCHLKYISQLVLLSDGKTDLAKKNFHYIIVYVLKIFQVTKNESPYFSSRVIKYFFQENKNYYKLSC